ncbi:MAG: phosphatase PAP2 family protein [Bacteroidota bacterium]
MLIRAFPLLTLLLIAAVPVQGQVDPATGTPIVAEDPPSTADVRLFRTIYDIEAPAFAATMRGVHWTSRNVFIGAVPAAWLGTLAGGGDRDYQPAYLLTLTHASTIGAVFALKTLIRRPRPYASLPGVTPRSGGHPSTFDPHSFPSGHAALSFALATSVSLSYPEWYVIAPSLTWAAAVSLSRPWLGVHYPSDVAVGIVLGTGIALGLHALGDAITPSGLRNDDEPDPLRTPSPPSVRFVIPF